jgi:hypothetical protein
MDGGARGWIAMGDAPRHGVRAAGSMIDRLVKLALFCTEIDQEQRCFAISARSMVDCVTFTGLPHIVIGEKIDERKYS